ncbi:DUF342 domain-containing protein [bacterium]|nr:DUF342 domain-containing protein [FCB group bacterium]MBL7192303.1 DUF342 domain-containing protein [bacterium]
MTVSKPIRDEGKISSGASKHILAPGEIRVISHRADKWDVEIFIKFEEISQDKLPDKLKFIKDQIAAKYGISPFSLKYHQLLEKEISHHGVLAHLVIERVTLDKGRPKFYFQSGISPSGMPYNDMVCYADLFLLDEFEKELTEERLKSLLKREEVKEECIDHKAVKDAVAQLKERGMSLQGVKAAEGKFPDSGRDAEVEFYFHAVPDRQNAGDYISSRKVEKGDLLCSKTPPCDGKEGGHTVRGRTIPPGKGLDIALEARKGAKLNMTLTESTAVERGLVVVRREERSFMTPAGEKVIPSKIIIRIDPLLVIQAGDDAVEITTRESVEIRGNLKIGSKIISSGEVHIDGDVEDSSNIHASDDIVVNGSVNGSSLTSGKNIIARNGINNSQLTASESVFVKGEAVKSNITGQKVVVDKMAGGQINAGQRIEAGELAKDEDGVSATLVVGMRQFLEKKITENNDFIEAAQTNLNKLRELFGDTIVNEVMPHNVQQMLLKFIAQLRHSGVEQVPQKKINSYKKLLTAIEPLKMIIDEKTLENIRIKRQMRRSGEGKSIVIVREKISAKTKINIDNVRTLVEPEAGPIKLTAKDKKILKDIYEPDSE